MAWTNPASHIWAVSEILTAGNMNTFIEANLAFLYGDTGWTSPSFVNSWGNFLTYQSGFRMVGTRVVFRGVMGGGTVPSTAFTLPVGYRPTQTVNFDTVANSAFALGTINPGGVFSAVVGSGVWFSLEDISFDTIP